MREFKGKSIIALPSEYIVIDTETTGIDYDYCSIIEIAAVKYVNGLITDKFTSLVKPPEYYTYDENGNVVMEYVDAFITELTGITNDMLATAPDTAAVIPQFLSFIGNSILVAHNANFDINFIYDAADCYCGTALTNDFIDTLRISRKVFPDLKHHRLADIAAACHVEQFEAHRSEADCLVTAQCFEYMRTYITSKMTEDEFKNLFNWHRNQHRARYAKVLSQISATTDEIDDSNPLYGKIVVFTGALSSMERKSAFQIVANLGGTPQDTVTKKTNYLVIGNSDFAKSVKNGKTTKMKKAESYQKEGCEILILSENAFFDLIRDYIQKEGSVV